MVLVDDAFEVRYKYKGKEVQILVDFDQLQVYRKNSESVELEDVLVDDRIYVDQKKGELASDDVLKTLFGDMSHEERIEKILQDGECQIPTAYLNKLRQEKKTQIINYISQNAHNPQTKTKYTYSMIERAFEDISMTIDPLKDAIYQAEEIIKDLRKKMPISMEKVMLIIKVPGMYCGKFYGPFRKMGTITKEFYDDQGALHLHFEIYQGSLEDVVSYIKAHSQGEAEYHIQK